VHTVTQWRNFIIDVKPGQNLEAEARAMRLSPKLRGQFLEVEAKAEAENNYKQECPDVADKPAQWETMSKITPVRSYNKFQSSRKSGV